MALRVLLADESVTIKKVFQLALQDFAVEVNSVTVGVDVLNVALKYKPDIVFADVLLQKKNGYDVCREIKTNPEINRTPVVLIWSGFMELDDAKYKSSGANAHLEKPFDTQRLRQIIQTLVAKTKSQPISGFLTFPKLPDFDDSATTRGIPPPPKSANPNLTNRGVANISGGFEPDIPPENLEVEASPEIEANDHAGGWNMDQFAEPLPPIPMLDDTPDAPAEDHLTTPTEDEEEFMPLTLAKEPTPSPPTPVRSAPPKPVEEEPVEEDAQWVQKTLSKYKLDPAQRIEEPPKVSYKVPDEKIDPDTFISNTWARPLADKKPAGKRAGAAVPPPLPVAPTEDEANEEEFELELNHEPIGSTTSSRASAASTGLPPQLSEQQLEAVIRAQSKEVIEKVVWQIVPEIATRIIERELERLLSERNQK